MGIRESGILGKWLRANETRKNGIRATGGNLSIYQQYSYVKFIIGKKIKYFQVVFTVFRIKIKNKNVGHKSL